MATGEKLIEATLQGNNNIHQASSQQQQPKTMIDHDDPLLIAQSLTYITDNGSVVASFQSAPFSFCKL